MKSTNLKPDTGKLRVFVADDNQMIRDALIQVIESLEGMVVSGSASDSEEAIAGIGNDKPDVVILDLRMPGVGGLEVLRTIRENDVKSVVIIFTAYSLQRYRLEAIRLGADHFYSKTDDNERMFDTLIALAQEKKVVHSI